MGEDLDSGGEPRLKSYARANALRGFAALSAGRKLFRWLLAGVRRKYGGIGWAGVLS